MTTPPSPPSDATRVSTTTRTRQIGLCLSGGGYRATAWGIGAAVGLARASETKPGTTVVSVSSVSGGSLANAALAEASSKDFDELRAKELLTAVSPMLRHVAHHGLIRYAAATNLPVFEALALGVLLAASAAGLVGALVGFDRQWQLDTVLFAGAVVAALLVGLALWRSRSALLPERVALVALAFVAPLALASGVVLGGRVEGTGVVVGTLVGLAAVTALVGWWFVWMVGRRGSLVERAMATGPLRTDGDAKRGPRLLAELQDRRVHHVFCATELQSGDTFYLSPRMAYGYRFGWSGSLGDWPLARAVQASAALPGGFPPQRTRFTDIGLRPGAFSHRPRGESQTPDEVVLVDGGVYDNMGTEWEVGFAARRTRLGGEGGPLEAVQPPADFLIVANAGKALALTEMKQRGLRGELAGLLRDQSIQYDQTTSTRRRSLVAVFRAAEAGAADLPLGVIVQASTSPLRVAETIAAAGSDAPPEKRVRAAAWVTALRDIDVDWHALADRNAAVPTVLSPIGPDVTVDLVWHAAVLTQVQLHIHYGIGAVDPMERALVEATVSTNDQSE